MRKTVVVGGGWAGLFAAHHAARRGDAVTVLERGHLGGRGRAPDAAGAVLHVGPRAIYLKGPAYRALQQMGVEVTGSAPVGGWGDAAWAQQALPATPWAMLTSPFLEGERVAFAAAILALRSAPATMSWGAWLDARGLVGRGRAVLDTLARLTTYANAPYQVPAATIAKQMRLAAGGVVYADGGWPGLITHARARLTARGVAFREGVHVTQVGATPTGWQVTSAAERFDADGVVLAVPPAVEARLTGRTEPAGLSMRAASLDLVLSTLPVPERTVALGVDRPLYMSVHSRFARLAPPGHAVVHVMRYLEPDEVGDRCELEAWMDRLQPGWRDHVVHARFASKLPVSHAYPTVDVPRLGVAIAPGLTRCGEHVGDGGLLLDGAASSAETAVASLRTSLARAA